ncbi:GNAT family N-acetyltransferase [Humibacter sp.]|uniref:GNAT family N-acetyltransferase n=1 Tax=Humibacter sp. TaxID=1940291 RepID=UPI003F7EF356
MPVLETERLVLRPWRLDDHDIDFAYDLYSRWDVQRYIGRTPRVIADRAEAETRVRHSGHGFASEAADAVLQRALDAGLP